MAPVNLLALYRDGEKREEEKAMPITIDLPPAIVKEIRDYEKATGLSMTGKIADFVEKELRRSRELARWEAEFDKLVAAGASRLPGPEPYKFNRADAYPEGEY